MILPHAPVAYDRANEQDVRRQLQTADSENFKKGQDVRLQRGERLILVDEVTGALYRIKLASGVLSVEAL